MITDQFDEMLAQSARQPLVCPISLHPFVFGRPYRIRRLRRALQHILGHGDRVWITRPRDICAHIESLPAGTVPDSQEDPMKIGVVLPQTEIGNDPGAIKAYAEAVEEMGFTHILVFDHVLGANPERPGGWKGPYTYRHAFHEPFVLFGFLAAATRRVGLVTGIIILPQRQTALVAKQAAAVDVLSGGRLRLGVGVGWNPVEFEALGEDFHTRGRRVEEQVEVMRALWTKELVTFDGPASPHHGRRPQPAAGAAADPGVDGRRERGCPAAHGPRRRRVDAPLPAGRRLAGDGRSDARHDPGGRPRPEDSSASRAA